MVIDPNIGTKIIQMLQELKFLAFKNDEMSIDKKTILSYLKENQKLIKELNFSDCIEDPQEEIMVRISYIGELLEKKYKVNDYVFQTNRHLF